MNSMSAKTGGRQLSQDKRCSISTNTRLRAVLLAALMFLWLFAGTVAFGVGAVAADEPADVQIQHAETSTGTTGTTGDDGVWNYAEVLNIEPAGDELIEIGDGTDRALRVREVGTDREFLVAPEDGEGTYKADRIRLRFYDGDGEISTNPSLIAIGPDIDDGIINVSVDGDSSFAGDGTFSAYEIDLVENPDTDDERVIDSTDERLIGVGYAVTREQNSTTDEVEVSFTRDEDVDESWYVEFGMYDDADEREPLVTEELQNTADADDFTVTLDASEFDDGVYDWGITLRKSAEGAPGEQILGFSGRDGDGIVLGEPELDGEIEIHPRDVYEAGEVEVFWNANVPQGSTIEYRINDGAFQEAATTKARFAHGEIVEELEEGAYTIEFRAHYHGLPVGNWSSDFQVEERDDASEMGELNQTIDIENPTENASTAYSITYELGENSTTVGEELMLAGGFLTDGFNETGSTDGIDLENTEFTLFDTDGDVQAEFAGDDEDIEFLAHEEDDGSIFLLANFSQVSTDLTLEEGASLELYLEGIENPKAGEYNLSANVLTGESHDFDQSTFTIQEADESDDTEESDDEDDDELLEEDGPGFGAVVALLGFLIASLLTRRR